MREEIASKSRFFTNTKLNFHSKHELVTYMSILNASKVQKIDNAAVFTVTYKHAR